MRMGLHVNNISAAVERMFDDYVNMVKPPWVKVLDGAISPRMVATCRANGAKILGRKVFGDGEQRLGAEGGRNIRRLVEYAGNHPEFDAVEGYNECYDEPGKIGRYAEWCIEFMLAMETIGRKACIGSFSTGTPENDELIEFRPALEHAWRYGHYLALHEYGGGTGGMRWGAGRNQWNNGRPVSDDPAEGPLVTGWWCLRYRKFLFPLLRTWGIGARVLITESGIDNITPRLGGQGNGWRDFMTAPNYAKDTIWYGRHLGADAAASDTGKAVSADNGIHGWVGFGDGSRRAGGDVRWRQFDILEEGDLVVVARAQLELPRTLSGNPAPPVAPPPVAPPTPSGPPAMLSVTVLPGENWYALCRRVYNLPIPTAPANRVAAAVWAIAHANNLNHHTTSLATGQVLVVPGWATLWPEEYPENGNE